MLEVGCGNGEFSLTEQRTHFNAWAIVSSPLILSLDTTDDRAMDAAWPIIANSEAIAVNQAWAGHSGAPFAASAALVPGKRYPAWQAYWKPVRAGATAVLLINHAGEAANLSVAFADVPGLNATGRTSFEVRDINAHADLGAMSSYSQELASHDAAFLLLTWN